MKERENQTANLLGTAPIGRLIARFAIPSVVAMLVNALYNIVDQIFIGRGTGYLGNGAANVVLLMTLAAISLSNLIGDGAAAYFSLNLGAGKKEQAGEGAGCALAAITAVSLACMALALVFLEPIIRLFGGTELLMPLAKEYGVPTILGLPLLMVSMTINALIRADGNPRYAMLSVTVGVILNGCLDPVLIFGFGWGIRGAAISSLVGQFVSFVLSVSYLCRFRNIRLSRRVLRLRPALLAKLSALGVSSFIDQMAFTLVMAVNNNLIVHYGALSSYGSEIPLTAYGLAMKVQEILFTILLGIAIGMQPIVGYNFGAKRFGRARKAYGLAIGVGTAVSALATVLFVFFPDPIIRLFGSQDNAVYLEFSRRFFCTYFLLYLSFGFQTITGVFFQAIGQAGQAAALSLSYQLGFKIAAAVLLSAAIGLDGVLWSGPAADVLIFSLTVPMVLVQLRKMKQMEAAQRELPAEE